MLSIYHPKLPGFLEPFLIAPEMSRLRRVGMHCGCEYTHFPRFRALAPYSRFDHSLGCALIVWHFTGEPAQTLAALFHDIATPTFAHAVDFLHGDYLKQESTEAGTSEIIRGSEAIMAGLRALGLTAADVEDYHRYPIADNDAPRLSADRLEYTLHNMLNYGFQPREAIRRYYDDLVVSGDADGAPELCFADLEIAREFALSALNCSRVYVSDEDRYAMQRLAEVLAAAVQKGILAERDLYGTEDAVIRRFEADPEICNLWNRFRQLHEMRYDDAAPEADRRIIRCKKRYIDPLVSGMGRLSEISDAYRQAKEQFLHTPQEHWICGQ